MKNTKCIVLAALLLNAYVLSVEKQNNQEKIYSREEIETEIQDAQKQFDEAKKMFNPWYAGPLLTPSPTVIGPGLWNIQPYLFITSNDKQYTSSGSTQNIPTLFQVNPNIILQVGVVKHVELIGTVQGLYSKQNGKDSFNIGDTSLKVGFEILKQTPYLPAIAFDIGETFPTGKYQHLNADKNGVDATGAGSYQTTFSFNIGKVIWWVLTHPMNVRLSLNYTIASNTHVKGFNAYGGGYGTNGTVNVGNNFSGDFGFEYSFTQKWVAACDVVYSYTSPSTFTGNVGMNKNNTPATVGSVFRDQLSLAPALEYNPTENLGFLAGVWFTVWGRNSLSFISGVLSFEYTF